MAKKSVKKKTIVKKAVQKKVAKKAVKKTSKKAVKKKAPVKTKKVRTMTRMQLAIRDLVLFSVLTLINFVLFLVSGKTIYEDTFYLLSIIFGFVSVAFLIIVLALLLARPGKKKK